MSRLFWMSVGMAMIAGQVSAQSPTNPITDTFRVAVEKVEGDKYQRVGQAKITCTLGAREAFSVKIYSLVTDPRDQKKYGFDLEMNFVLKRSRLYVSGAKRRYTEAAEEHRSRIESLIPFYYLAKYTRPPRPSEDPERGYHFLGAEYTIRYHDPPDGRHLEATLVESGQPVGKFFLCEGATGSAQRVHYFRLYPERGRALRFVKLRPDGSDVECGEYSHGGEK